MARPIKETPTLRGEEARLFEQRLSHPHTISSVEVREAHDAYNRVMSIAKFAF